MFARLLLVVTVVAACGEPRAWIDADHLEGTRPEWVILRCRTSGLSARPRYSWKLPGGVRAVGVGQPLDESALLVQLNDNLHNAETVECVASTDKDAGKPKEISAQLSMGPCQPASARIATNLLTVDGSGFGAQAGADDSVWLVPPRGAAVRADHACKGGSWSEGRIVACVPKLEKKPYQVRVQSGGRLGLGPLVSAP